jgi:hypothetical protein
MVKLEDGFIRMVRLGQKEPLEIAQLLKDEELPIDIEFVAFNGEEYYGIGECLYIEKRNNDFICSDKVLEVVKFVIDLIKLIGKEISIK